MECYHEPGRAVPIVKSCGVLVCGGGPAGVAAALAAARTGADTVLLEMQGCLGGIWTSGALTWIMDGGRKTGVMADILSRLQARKAGRFCRSNHFISDTEEMKLLLEEMCMEAGVTVRLYTRITGAAKDERGDVKLVLTESPSGREAWEAGAFVDATGNGDLAAYAGCGFDLGQEATGAMQPMSLIVHISGIRAEDAEEFNNCLEYTNGNPKKKLLQEMQKAGVRPSYEAPSLFHVREDLYLLMTNHEYGVSGINADDLTRATLRARGENHRLIGALRALGGRWERARIVVTAAHIGVREGRRIHGLYRVGLEDLTEGRSQADAVCRVYMGIDIHSVNPEQSRSFSGSGLTAKPYDIPLRALIAKDAGRLLMAGRCISGDFYAHSSYRVTGDAAATGQGAGTAAALSVLRGERPEEVPWPEMRKALDGNDGGR